MSLTASNGTASDLANLTVQSPADGSMVVPSNSTNNVMRVTAFNGEYTPINWYPGCSNIVGPITRCVGSPASISIPGRQSRNGTIYFDVGEGPATASFDPEVLDSNVPTTQVTIAAPDFRVTVTPEQATATLPHDAPQYLTFTVKNIGSNPTTYTATATCGGTMTYTATATCGGTMTCAADPAQQVSLASGASASVGVSFRTGAPGTTATRRTATISRCKKISRVNEKDQ